MGWAVLKITDGTKAGTIDLLNTNAGYLLDDWRPAIQIPKSGGIWNGSPLTDGRRLAMRNYENAIEVFNLKVSKASQDEIIVAIQDLFRLMNMAVNYWITGWQTTPVYIEAKATNETNTRYATIMDYRISGLNNPYAQPFFACPSIEDEFMLTIEHDYWMEQPPGTDTAIEISAQQVYNGVTYGRSATTSDEVFIANKHVKANITHAYYFDLFPGATFSLNMIGMATPFDFLPDPHATGDMLYFGCNTALADSGPFNSVVFDITTASTSDMEVDWYYWNGAWAALDVTDNLHNTVTGIWFNSTGVRFLSFAPPADWDGTLAVNGVTGYWIRGVLTVNVYNSTPEQGNRDFYSAVVPFVDIDELQVPGDVPALSRFELESSYGFKAMAAGTKDFDLYAAIRSKSRGSDFTPYINLSDEQNIVSGITISAGTDVAIADYVTAPTGRSYRWQATTDAEAMRVRIAFSGAAANKYEGRFVAMLRLYSFDGGDTLLKLQVNLRTSATAGDESIYMLYESASQSQSSDAEGRIFDFGIVDLPGSAFRIDIVGSDADSTNDIYFFDLILIPADEWLSKYHGEWEGDEGLSQDDEIIIDSITSPKNYHSADVYQLGSLKAPMSVNGAGQSILQPNADQRMWFFSKGVATSSYVPFMVTMSRMARYMAMRGSR